MNEKFELKIIRLVTNEDIIGFVCQGKKIEIKYPKIFYYDFVEDEEEPRISLTSWLQKDFYALDEVTIERNKILFISYANTDFGVIYLESLLTTVPKSDILYSRIEEYIAAIQSQTRTLH